MKNNISLMVMVIILTPCFTYGVQTQGKNFWSAWSYETGNLIDLSVSPEGSYVAAGKVDKVYLFNLGGSLLWSYDIDDGSYPPLLSVSSNASYIAVGGGDLENYRFHLFSREGVLLWSYEGRMTEPERPMVSVSPHGSYVVGGAGREIYFFSREGELLWSRSLSGSINEISVTSDGSYAVAVADDGRVYFFSREGELLWKREIIDSYDVSVSPNGSTLAVMAHEMLYFLNKEGKLLRNISVEGLAVHEVLPSSGSYIATKKHKEFYFFNRKGEQLWRYKIGDKWPGEVSVSPDGSVIALEDGGRLLIFANAGAIRRMVSGSNNVVASEKAKGFSSDEAETLLSMAEEALSEENYGKAGRLASKARVIALDIDGDGVPNAPDSLPEINNYYIYALAAIFLAILGILSLRKMRRVEVFRGLKGIPKREAGLILVVILSLIYFFVLYAMEKDPEFFGRFILPFFVFIPLSGIIAFFYGLWSGKNLIAFSSGFLPVFIFHLYSSFLEVNSLAGLNLSFALYMGIFSGIIALGGAMKKNGIGMWFFPVLLGISLWMMVIMGGMR